MNSKDAHSSGPIYFMLLTIKITVPFSQIKTKGAVPLWETDGGGIH